MSKTVKRQRYLKQAQILFQKGKIWFKSKTFGSPKLPLVKSEEILNLYAKK